MASLSGWFSGVLCVSGRQQRQFFPPEAPARAQSSEGFHPSLDPAPRRHAVPSGVFRVRRATLPCLACSATILCLQCAYVHKKSPMKEEPASCPNQEDPDTLLLQHFNSKQLRQ